jgi:hypothetical protein
LYVNKYNSISLAIIDNSGSIVNKIESVYRYDIENLNKTNDYWPKIEVLEEDKWMVYFNNENENSIHFLIIED